MQALKLRKIGSSLGVILPKDMIENQHLKEGDQLFANANGEGIHMTPLDPEFEAAMAAFGKTRRKYRNALHQLAK
ncbi:MAG: AbrB/MazE/SpoVT family DNA-binding domain-containing protein [Candidatus Thiodiazotropha sp. (ex Lucinoma kastoroae)]|nr:AbrB/MazE/SpoVT family DNA-binding domain-containing protein [Candidatus Thiodiazotropha sp. (ex Lucinoma kastoroae)]